MPIQQRTKVGWTTCHWETVTPRIRNAGHIPGQIRSMMVSGWVVTLKLQRTHITVREVAERYLDGF